MSYFLNDKQTSNVEKHELGHRHKSVNKYYLLINKYVLFYSKNKSIRAYFFSRVYIRKPAPLGYSQKVSLRSQSKVLIRKASAVAGHKWCL